MNSYKHGDWVIDPLTGAVLGRWEVDVVVRVTERHMGTYLRFKRKEPVNAIAFDVPPSDLDDAFDFIRFSGFGEGEGRMSWPEAKRMIERIGPLFGVPKEVDDEVIYEDFDAWKSAAAALAYGYELLGVLGSSGQIHEKALSDTVFRREHTRVDMLRPYSFELIKEFEAGYSDTYAKSFYPNSPERPHRPVWDEHPVLNGSSRSRVRDGYSCRTNVSIVFDETSEYILRLSTRIDPEDRANAVRFPAVDFYSASDLANLSELDRGALSDPLGLLLNMTLQQLISLHVQEVRLDWVPNPDTRDAFAFLEPFYKCRLQFFWHQLALRYAKGKVSLCKQCGNAISTIAERGKKREFCDDRCKDNWNEARRRKERKEKTRLVKEASSMFNLADDEDFERAVRFVSEEAEGLFFNKELSLRDVLSRLENRSEKRKSKESRSGRQS